MKLVLILHIVFYTILIFPGIFFCSDVSIEISRSRQPGIAYYCGSVYFQDKEMCFYPTAGCNQNGIEIDKEDRELDNITLSKQMVRTFEQIKEDGKLPIEFLITYKNDDDDISHSYYFSLSSRESFYGALSVLREAKSYQDLKNSSSYSSSSSSSSSYSDSGGSGGTSNGSDGSSSSYSGRSSSNSSKSSSSSDDGEKKQGDSVESVMTINVSAFTNSEQADGTSHLPQAYLCDDDMSFYIKCDGNVIHNDVCHNDINKIILAINSTKNFSMGNVIHLRCDLNGKEYKLGIYPLAYQNLEQYTESTKESYFLSTKTEQINIIHVYCSKYEDYTKETKQSGALKKALLLCTETDTWHVIMKQDNSRFNVDKKIVLDKIAVAKDNDHLSFRVPSGIFLCVAIEQAREVVTQFQEEQKNKLKGKQVLQNNTTSMSIKTKLFGGSMLLAGFIVLYMYYQGFFVSNLLDMVL